MSQMDKPSNQSTKALSKCLDVLLRSIPDYCDASGALPCSSREHDKAIAAAARVLYGQDQASWPSGVRDASLGRYN